MRSDPDSYRETMLLVVNESFEASSQNATIEEQMLKAASWSDLLFDIIPESRLMEVFRRAFREKDSTFTVNAYDLKNTWYAIQAEESAARLKAYDDDKAANPVRYCSNQTEHINDAGDVEIVLGGPNGTTVVIPCSTCRTEASYRRLAEEQAKLPKVQQRPVRSVVMEMFNNAVTGGLRVAETPLEILVRARNEVITTGGVQQTIDTLTHAIEYVRSADKRNW